jgi:Putative beta barrel porin-7 (BBP7)
MRNGFLASLSGLLLGAGLVLGQPPSSMPEALTPEGESRPASVEPAPTGPAPPHGIFGDLESHFDGTCDRLNGNVFVAEVDYLFWALRNANIPVPLASTNAVGVSGTQILIGQHDLNYYRRPNSGLRVSLQYWQQDPLPELDWDKPRTIGVEANYLLLGQRGIAERNDTASTLIRPFFSVNSQSETGIVVAAPGIATGGVTASANYGLWGGELNLWKNIFYEYPGKTVRLDFLAGFRYLDLGEDLSLTSLTQFTQTPGGVFTPFAGNQILANDLFHTRDQFYGAQIGAVAKFFLEVLDVNLAGKIAFGGNAEQVLIEGFQQRTLANGTVLSSPGGVLAVSSNMGRHHHTEFSVVPEFDATASYVICRHASLVAGYQFIYWSRVIRPGDQIDRGIDVTRIPNFPIPGVAPSGVARPTVPLRQTDFWAQGLTVGLQFVW